MFSTNETQCSLWPGKLDRCQVIYVLSKLTASVSIIGCFIVMLLIVILKKYKYFVHKLILSLALSAFLESIGYVSNDNAQEISSNCRFLGFFVHYFGWAIMLWVLVITVNMLLTIKQCSSPKYVLWFHFFVWTTSFVVALIPFSNDSYGPAGIWCWIRKDYTKMRFGTWYIPLFVIGILMLIIYLYIIFSVLRKTRATGIALTVEEEQENRRYREELRPLLTYPLIYILFTIPGLMYRIDDAAHPKKPPNYALVILSVIFLQSIGLGNSISFIIHNSANKEISWTIFKQHVIALFSPNPQIIYENYQVDDVPVPRSDRISEITKELSDVNLPDENSLGIADNSNGKISIYT